MRTMEKMVSDWKKRILVPMVAIMLAGSPMTTLGTAEGSDASQDFSVALEVFLDGDARITAIMAEIAEQGYDDLSGQRLEIEVMYASEGLRDVMVHPCYEDWHHSAMTLFLSVETTMRLIREGYNQAASYVVDAFAGLRILEGEYRAVALDTCEV